MNFHSHHHPFGGAWWWIMGQSTGWGSDLGLGDAHFEPTKKIFSVGVLEHHQAPAVSVGSLSGPSRGRHAHFWRPLPEAAFLSVPSFYLLKLLRSQHHAAVCLVILWGKNQPHLWTTGASLLQGSCIPAGQESRDLGLPALYLYSRELS